MKYVTIYKNTFLALIRDADFVERLQRAGVDNWDGVDFVEAPTPYEDLLRMYEYTELD